MRLSIALCTFDGARFLQQQLESIAAQSRLPDEVVVNDDASTDETFALLEAFAEVAPFPVRVERNEHRVGVTANFERAVRRCTGDVIVFCDQDDLWRHDRLSTLEAVFADDPAVAMAFSDAELIDGADRSLGLRLWDAIDLGPSQRERMRRDAFGFVLARPAVTGCTLAIRSDSVDLLLPFPNEDAGGDVPVLHDWWVSVALAAFGGSGRVALVEEPLVSYRIHSGQRIGLPGWRIRRRLPARLLRLRSIGVPRRTLQARLAAVGVVLHDIEARFVAHGIARHEDVGAARAHLVARGALAEGRLRRVPAVARELRAGRYDRYSIGLVTAVADVLRPG